jgi:cell wall-associated NlpC family hydrolase
MFGYEWDTAGARFKTPPRGALVFWDGGNSYDSKASQVAISLGNGRLVSTGEGRTPFEVHLLTISERNAEPGVGAYLGWVMPIPGYHIQQ